MNQVLHILRKDLRHHWPEILLSLALLVAFAIEQPRKWSGQLFDTRFLTGLLNFLPGLLVLSWAFLIARIVQGESLVGDRQFWITRPYEWHKLLSAKLLSILLYIHLPLFITQLVLLKVADFPVLASVPGLLFIHLLLASAFVYPALTLASITSGIGQTALALLLVLLCMLGIVLLTTVMPDMDFATDATDNIQFLLYFAAGLTAIFVQYIYRKTVLARLVVASGVALILLVILLAPYRYLINREFPLPTLAHPLPAKLTFDRTLSFAHTGEQRFNSFGDDVSLEFPFLVGDQPEKSVTQLRAIKLDIELPTGEHWSSHWQSVYHTLSFGRTRDWPGITMKKTLFNRVKDVPLKAHMTLGFRVFKLGTTTSVSLSGDRVNIPGGARCLNNLTDNWLRCFSALEEPQPLVILAELPNAACPVSKESLAEGLAPSPASFSVLTTDSDPDLAFSPIQEFTVELNRYYVYEDRQIRLPICPGTPLLVSKPEFLYAVRDEIDLGEITLMNYEPTYPRKIVPPPKHPSSGAPEGTLSQNSAPPSLTAGPS